jgi:hypothetical protein
VHLLVRAESRVAFQNFLRTVAALLARRITGARKGKPVGKFWDALAFSSLVKWGSQMAAVHRYFSRNRLEAIGFFTPDDRTLTYEVALGVATTRRRL